MTNLVGFHYRQRVYTVRRYTTCVTVELSCKRGVPTALNISQIHPEATLRLTWLGDTPSVLCTLVGASVTETLTLTKFSASLTSNKFPGLEYVTCTQDGSLSIYTTEEVGLDIGQVTGAVYTTRRAIGTDEFGRVTLVSSSVMVCLPGVEIRSDDVLIDQETNETFSVVEAQQAFDRRGRLHHWELDVVRIRER